MNSPKMIHEIFGDDPDKLIPVIIQDRFTKDVLFLGYTNREAFEKSICLREVVLYSRGREKIWHKGSTSGDFLHIHEAWINCERNCFLYIVDKLGGGVCHIKDNSGKTMPTCFFQRLF
ncbi:MAG: phosphoribosyl-AMP cyclohydrolase [Parcubacteria group bacterium CG11_big_fil_rev_8_21_14_0_20_41_14]|nr:MAG: phosphoribosyl-AMP cyclohydrolase [Parcubacteria group bacterium CG11_big_fil_rev_8_21_14_0_20_41_14]PIR57182.1 MAG: phosphoribosyl-AMP cyclohydrolase [Parcubacteria group bacterium CG10_big_fil_rev_8_21_14_0_10_41_35]PIZ82394.1 MAG: phosphoribosyl-AMP cyclohydrolase [Parcubacteria group bacterium CG_4_10_14_0_2_um_filter_41_6]